MGRTTTSPSGCRPFEGHQSGVDQEVFVERCRRHLLPHGCIYACFSVDQ